jgi:hypothetical protein
MTTRYQPIRDSRTGASSLELLIAFTLLASVIAFATPLAVKHNRLLTAQRNYRVALDELSNQVDRLMLLSDAELREAVTMIRPSEFASQRMPGVKIQGQLEPIDVGQRLTLSLSWDDQPSSVPPISLSAWVVPRAATAAAGQAGRGHP